MKKKNRSANSTFLFVFLFLGFLSVLLIASLTFKLLSVWSRNLYDTNSQFHLALQNDKEKNSIYFVAFTPKNQSIIVVEASSEKPISSNILKIPIDANVSYVSDYDSQKLEIEKQLWYFLTHYGSVTTHMTLMDIMNLYWYTKTIPSQNISYHTFSLPEDELLIDTDVLRLFADEDIVVEKKSIQIVNATGKSGVGNRLARLLSNMGGNVVDVTTSDTATSSSRIAITTAPGYTVKRLSSILKAPVVLNETEGISDIIIIVGEDAFEKVSF